MGCSVIIIKKYSNRRLYDTDESRYVTLDELAAKVRDGHDVQVVDAKSGEDLTQPTLTQIIIESRGAAKLLPANLLLQLVRLNDHDLSEFLGRYLAGALELYQMARRGAENVAPMYPMAQMPFAATNAFARLMMGAANFGGRVMGRDRDPAHAQPAAPPASGPPAETEISKLRRELEEIKAALRGE